MTKWFHATSINGDLDRLFVMNDGCLLKKAKPRRDEYRVKDVIFTYVRRFKFDGQEYDVYKVRSGNLEDLEKYDCADSDAFRYYNDFSEQMGGFRKCISLWDNT